MASSTEFETDFIIFLTEICDAGEGFLRKMINGTNAIRILLFSTTYRLDNLNRDASKYLNNNLCDIEMNEQFFDLNFEQIENLISERNKEVKSILLVFPF